MTDIAKEIANLVDLKTRDLREVWQRIYRAEL